MGKARGSVVIKCKKCGKIERIKKDFYTVEEAMKWEKDTNDRGYCSECEKKMEFESHKANYFEAEIKYSDYKYIKADKRIAYSYYNEDKKTMSVLTTVKVEDIIAEKKATEKVEEQKDTKSAAQIEKERIWEIIDSEDKKLISALFIEKAKEFNVDYIIEGNVITVLRTELNALSKYDRSVFYDIIDVFEEVESNKEYIKFIAGEDTKTKVITMKYADAKKSGFEKVNGTYSKEDNTVDVIVPADYEYKQVKYHEVEMLYKDYKSKYSQYKNKHNYSDRNGTITVYLPEGVEYVRSEKDEHYEELHAFKEGYTQEVVIEPKKLNADDIEVEVPECLRN